MKGNKKATRGLMLEKISVIGIGKLGAPMAACFAAKGFDVVAVDVDVRKIDAINRGESPIFEPRVEEMMASAKGRLSATQDLEAAVLATTITFVVVATPSEADGSFSLRHVLPVCEKIGSSLRKKNGFHLVVLTSTVMPGSTGGEVRATLERSSGLHAGREFGLCYNPEFIALGSVVRNFLNPDFLLIGESDECSGKILEGIYKRVCDNKPPASRLTFVDAEIAKLAVNTFVTTKISFANMLARICERVPGSSVDAVTGALGMDSRIGPRYLKGAISYGGPCFPRDNIALASLAKRVGSPADIAQATDSFNRGQIRWLADLVQRCLSDCGTAGILGLTYKPNTDVVEEAPGWVLAQELTSRGVSVVAFDPAAVHTSNVFPSRVEFASTATECIAKSDVVAIATPWAEFANIKSTKWARCPLARTVVDCWREFSFLERVDGVNYVPLGTGAILPRAPRPPELASVPEAPKEPVVQSLGEGGAD
jgi:UDPglucose 6-dehydrogenase